MGRKSIVILLALLVLMLGATGVSAAGGKSIEVFYNIKHVIINDVEKKLDQPAFIHNGTTYVPLRFIAEALNEPVEWDGSTGTLYIGEKEGQAYYPVTHLKHINFQKKGLICECQPKSEPLC